jgi:hypothetical protein
MKNNCGPQPDDPVELALWYFANLANWGNLHPLDDDRFYAFVVTAYEHGNRWKEENVERHLVAYGMREELIKKLLQRFEIGIGVLHKRKMMEQEEAKSASN